MPTFWVVEHFDVIKHFPPSFFFGGITLPLSVAKPKDDADGHAYDFRLEVVELGKDSFGDAITSCAVVEDVAVKSPVAAKKPRGTRQKTAVDALAPAFRDGVIGIAGVPDGRQAIDYETAVNLVASRLSCAPNKRMYEARNVIGDLLNSGFYGLLDEWLWLK